MKKSLVDSGTLDVTQPDFEALLFGAMAARGYGPEYADCCRLVTAFYQMRRPLAIVVCGAAWTGKSAIAQALAARINVPNVMQTDVVYEVGAS